MKGIFFASLLALVSCAVPPPDRSNGAFQLLPEAEYGPPARLALVQMEMLAPQDPERRVAEAFAAIDTAGRRGVDLIVLPEGVNIGAGGELPYRKVGVSLGSPMLKRVAAKPAKYHCYIAFPFIEREGERVFNSATLFGRDGSLFGVYHKVHEPRCEILAEGVSLGHKFPVFETDS